MAKNAHDNDGGEEDTVIGLNTADMPPKLIEPGDVDGNTVIISGADARTRVTAPVIAPAIVDDSGEESARVSFAMCIGTHAPIPLEVPAYIGRRPSTPRITGTRMPRLVMVPSPSMEVSSTHVEIRQEANYVVVTDLGSTNGTTVTVPGLPPRPLRQGESLVVGAGTWVDIGDGIRISIEKSPQTSTTEGPQ